jgi:hypothetical protein
MKLIRARNEDRASPNGVAGTALIVLLCVCIFCGKTLWVPASRVENLYVRSILLSVADAVTAFADWTRLDACLPELRSGFVDATGLAANEAWNTKYYNSRNGISASLSVAKPESATGASAKSPGSASPANASDVASSVQPDSGSMGPVDVQSIVPSRPALPPVLADIRGGPAGSYAKRDSFSLEVSGLTVEPGTVSPAKRPTFSGPAGYIHSAENPLHVFMFGDSQVFSLGSGLSRLAGKESPIVIESLPIHSSGFIRADYYNWPAKLQDTFSAGSYEAAIMMLGMNDYQNFWDNNGKIMIKHTPEWESAYKEKCRAIIDIVLSSVPRLYWIGMPVVRNGVYDESLSYINSVQDSLASEYSPDVLVRFSLRDSFPGEGKTYRDSVELGSGKTLRVMSDDGSHFTVEGGQYAMKPLFDRLAVDYLFKVVPVAHLPE